MNTKDILKISFFVLSALMVTWLCGNETNGVEYAIFGLFAKKPKVPKPIDIWASKLPQKQAAGMLGYYGEYIPQFLQLEETLTPQFLEQGFTSGEQALTGLLGLQDIASTAAAERLAALRAQEMEAMTGQVPLFRSFAEGLSPEQAEMVRASAAEASRATTAAQGLSPEERRKAEQEARAGYSAAGRLGGNAALLAEALGREDILAGKRAEAAGARQQAFTQAGQFYTAPGFSMLGATPASYGAGTTLAGTGLSLGESMSPQFDYNAPINLGLMRAGALDKQRAAQAQADAQYRSGILGSIGSAVGLLAAPFTGGLSAGLGLTGLAGGAAGATGLSGLGLSAGMGLSSLYGGIPRATPVY